MNQYTNPQRIKHPPSPLQVEDVIHFTSHSHSHQPAKPTYTPGHLSATLRPESRRRKVD